MYEELLAQLRDESNCDVLDYVDEAADAIETLVAQLVEKDKEITCVTAERDAAIADIKHPSVCECCKRDCQGDDICIDNKYMNFDWRGQREE